MNPISLLEQNPLRIEDRKRKMDDGAGGILEVAVLNFQCGLSQQQMVEHLCEQR
jgi:hypothetical protein